MENVPSANPNSQINPALPPGNELIALNPYWVGGSFLEYCVRQGWMVKQGQGRSLRYFCTPAGMEALRRFGIEIKRPEERKAGRPTRRPGSRQASHRR